MVASRTKVNVVLRDAGRRRLAARDIGLGLCGVGHHRGHVEQLGDAVISAGLSAQVTSTITAYVNYDGQLGRENYDSNAVAGGIKISF